MNKVSIIVPVYNVEEYLSRCVDSLLSQTHQDVEVILIDDASKDKSAQIIQEYASKDTRVKGFFQERNQGVSAARNRGLDEATGEWIAFCDGDDWYLPDFVETMLKKAEEGNADFAVCNYQIVSEGGSPLTVDCVGGIKADCSNKRVVACGPVSSCCHLFHRELIALANVRYPVGIGHSEELPVIPVLAKHAKKIVVVDKAFYCYFQRSSGTSASNTQKDIEPEIVCALSQMRERLGEDYEKEGEYHAIYNLLYGELLRLCKQKAPRRVLKEKICKYETEYKGYAKNPYYSCLGKTKRIFLWLERRRMYCMMKVFAKLHGMFIH